MCRSPAREASAPLPFWPAKNHCPLFWRRNKAAPFRARRSLRSAFCDDFVRRFAEISSGVLRFCVLRSAAGVARDLHGRAAYDADVSAVERGVVREAEFFGGAGGTFAEDYAAVRRDYFFYADVLDKRNFHISAELVRQVRRREAEVGAYAREGQRLAYVRVDVFDHARDRLVLFERFAAAFRAAEQYEQFDELYPREHAAFVLVLALGYGVYLREYALHSVGDRIELVFCAQPRDEERGHLLFAEFERPAFARDLFRAVGEVVVLARQNEHHVARSQAAVHVLHYEFALAGGEVQQLVKIVVVFRKVGFCFGSFLVSVRQIEFSVAEFKHSTTPFRRAFPPDILYYTTIVAFRQYPFPNFLPFAAVAAGALGSGREVCRTAVCPRFLPLCGKVLQNFNIIFAGL